MYRQTLCFIKKNDELLMLNREKTPTKGLWNGVGGKMEDRETPLECVIREVKEETGIDINMVEYKGTITWEVDNSYSGGLFVFLAEVSDTYLYNTPRKIEEGILDWKKISWTIDKKNLGGGEMIPAYLPILLGNQNKYEHACVISNGKLAGYTYKELDSAISN
ncbi:8-oxo-dGTP diphosphatase [Bacillus cereus]|uniref:MutT/nudix family protein n=1 Tax=Bacillus cereus (strain AH820) TaxID=405535 RepID=B7JG11_BACC0|nr:MULTISPECIES: 8-oxo-dGTP diphosphatase [Bacillus cereus group]HDR7530822.1 8-oxo-dGTP diphosphatase [Bacillus anthracis]ACK91916.1 MutT/nudix family protein [Bacillus cereus AH820]AJH65125.1 NUDIX domain protein [Bacillus cereus]AJK37063.1 NUDIX domain protein [Bacillus cereus]KAA0748041.1 8-oxo-dGTP diphosphatase [Bacillus sp. AY1-10]